MSAITVVIHGYEPLPVDWYHALAATLAGSGVRRVVLVGPEFSAPGDSPLPVTVVPTDEPLGGETWNRLLVEFDTPLFATLPSDARVELAPHTLPRLATVCDETLAPLVYSDHRARTADGVKVTELIDYQVGSIRDSFDFGPIIVWRTAACRTALDEEGPLAATQAGGLYELRLRSSTERLPVRIPEPLYTALALDQRPTGKRQFDYVDPRNQAVQQEFEKVATRHLHRVGALLPAAFESPPPTGDDWPVEASVIIPVRNRVKTIGDAARAALDQQADFAFNVIVVDNHSDDGTGDLLDRMAAEDDRLVRLVPDRDDLGIGGCWDYAIRSPHVGRYAVQLDSDDVYSGPETVAQMVGLLRDGPHVMVVGSYRLVDFELNEIPPGLIDHREWTRENGHNNLLRVNGLGAPRAFQTSVLRELPIPNVSYGEDYAIGLRLSRTFEIGRIYDPLYLCRRWGGNSDADLPIATKNRYDVYKDRIRTVELLARQHLNRVRG